MNLNTGNLQFGHDPAIRFSAPGGRPVWPDGSSDFQDNDQAFTGNAMNGSRPPGGGHAGTFRGHGFRTSDPRDSGHRQDKSRLECFNCGLKGHYSYECHVP